MADLVEVKVPDIGDFADVPIIEVLVSPGDAVEAEDPLITLESDKATMDVPAPQAGVVKELKVNVGDTVSEESVILTLGGCARSSTSRCSTTTSTARRSSRSPLCSTRCAWSASAS
jgi:pyruvate/2-oxoglutarate dehydrogenase complex dihydrolipoamide acyltransferase (E2) component